jgi:hypothetical protein
MRRSTSAAPGTMPSIRIPKAEMMSVMETSMMVIVATPARNLPLMTASL